MAFKEQKRTNNKEKFSFILPEMKTDKNSICCEERSQQLHSIQINYEFRVCIYLIKYFEEAKQRIGKLYAEKWFAVGIFNV